MPIAASTDLAAGGIGARSFQRLAAAVAEERFAIDCKFVAFGMATKIIVIVEDKNRLICSFAILPEMCGRETRYAAANNDQVVDRFRVPVGSLRLHARRNYARRLSRKNRDDCHAVP